MHKVDKFFSLLRFSLDAEAPMPQISGEEWGDMYRMARNQAVQGVVLQGVNRMAPDIRPPRPLLLQWIGEGQAIEHRNRQIDDGVGVVARWFAKRGFRSCLLKGQGNALMYPVPSSRCPGDIDIWVEGSDEEVIRLVKTTNRDEVARYHHIVCQPYKDIEVEAHYRPGFMFNPIHNRRLQDFFMENRGSQMDNTKSLGGSSIAVPTTAFNIVYQLAHIHNHLFDQGIGLRQMTDYYLLLSHATTADMPSEALLRRLGLWKMAGTVMYVMRYVFALEESQMIAPIDERRGKLMLGEILAGGNFGQHDTRFGFRNGRIWHNIQRLWRDMRLIVYFPSPCFWEPFFRIWNFVWRMRHR